MKLAIARMSFYMTPRGVVALQGKEHSRLRQHINKALKLPDLSLSPYRKEDAHSCIGLLQSWYERLTEEKSVEVTGYWYVLACIKNGHQFSPGSLEGIVTRAAGRIVGVTSGGRSTPAWEASLYASPTTR